MLDDLRVGRCDLCDDHVVKTNLTQCEECGEFFCDDCGNIITRYCAVCDASADRTKEIGMSDIDMADIDEEIHGICKFCNEPFDKEDLQRCMYCESLFCDTCGDKETATCTDCDE